MSLLSDEELAANLEYLIAYTGEDADGTASGAVNFIRAHIDALTAQRDRAVADKAHAWAVRDRVTAFASRTVKAYRAEQDALIAQRDAAREMVVALTSEPGDEQDVTDEDRLPIADRTLDALLGRS